MEIGCSETFDCVFEVKVTPDFKPMNREDESVVVEVEIDVDVDVPSQERVGNQEVTDSRDTSFIDYILFVQDKS